MEKKEIQRDGELDLQRTITEGGQHEGTRPKLMILTFESVPLVLYAIGWLDFEEIISQWPDDMLKQIIEDHERLHQQRDEERKDSPSSIVNSNWKDHSVNFEI